MRDKKPLHFLIVEDSNSFRQVAVTMLAEYKCTTADSGKAAIEQYRATQPNIVFLDISLPDIQGFQVFEEIRKINPHAFIVMLTQSNMTTDVQHAQLEGANGYIVKPFSRKQLKQCIDQYLNQTEGTPHADT